MTLRRGPITSAEKQPRRDVLRRTPLKGDLRAFSGKDTRLMTTRNHLLAVGSTVALVAGSLLLTTAPATAAPDSQTCVSARAELGAAVDSASVDIALAYDLKAAFAAIDQAAVELEDAWLEAEFAAEDEGILFDEALLAYDEAAVELADAETQLVQLKQDQDDATTAVDTAQAELDAVDVNDTSALAAAQAKLVAAQAAQQEAAEALAGMQTTYDDALAGFEMADQALTDAETAYFDALFTDAVAAAEDKFFAAIEKIESIVVALDGPGTSPEQVEAMVDAVIDACAAAGTGEGTPPASDSAISTGVDSDAPASTDRGLNIQTAAVEETEAGRNVMAAGGLLGAGTAIIAAVVVMVRRRISVNN